MAVIGPTLATHDFEPAARRHHEDAIHLCHHERYASADHLAGFAAECALKALLVGFLGVSAPSRGYPSDAQGNRFGHLPGLWRQAELSAQGRVGARFLTLLTGTNPFLKWDVSDRYSDGSSITAGRAWAHIAAAGALVKIQERAKVFGAVP
jgi:hypothetical protein